MKKRHISALAGLMTLILLFSVTPVTPVMAETKTSEIPSAMTKVAENDSLALYFNEKDTGIAVLNKESGDVFFSNPQDTDNDKIASAFQKKQLKAQIFLRYFNENVQEGNMDNYNDSIAEGQFEVEKLDDGLKITYSMGEGAVKLLLPGVISVERMESFAANLDSSKSKKLLRNYTKYDLETMKESDKKEILETYPGLETHPIYVLKAATKDYIKEELSQYLESVGYTWEDYEFDLTDNGYTSENTKPWFNVPLTYRLEGKNLIAEIDPKEVEYNEEGYYLVDIEVLPYFGAAVKGTEGYLFVPDGSGALINYDNGNTTVYSAKVYGQDVTMNVLSSSKSQIDQTVTVKLPVFGAKLGSKAWYAVIEDGDGYADITASVSGRVNSYNNVYAGFQFLEYGTSSLGDMVGANSFQMYSTADFTGNYRLRFSFLSGDEADYSGMAAGYRNYLLEQGVLKERISSNEVPFYVEYIGAIDKSATFLGIKYRAVTPVTTYAQAEEIVDTLLDSGVKDINVIYSGWSNGGLHGTSQTKLKPIGKLSKGGVSQSEFLSDMNEKNVDTFFTAEFQHVYYDNFADGYTLLGSAPKYFDLSPVKEATYYLSNDMSDENDKIRLIKPSLASKVAAQFKKKFSGKENMGINLGTISYNLYTDQQPENYTDRQKAKNYNTEAVQILDEAFSGRLLGDNANAYMLGQISDLINAPFDSNHARIIDTPVPFYEMVLHGYMNYSGDCMNLTDDYNTTLLKSLETGAGLYFKWIYADNSVLKETDFDSLYSVNYNSWIDKAIEDYKTVREVLSPLSDQTIIKHETLSKKTVRVTYEKGTQILLNYSDQDVVIDGQKVAAGSFAVVTRNEK
ncbi:MAG: hypothetical protein K6F63_07875 [Lachnospiraceae bacterium]|nr:hypothetical protein [Lachnospiraceae bacterium]